MRLLESRMNENVHVRFGGGLTEKYRVSYQYMVTRRLPTLQQSEQEQRGSGGGGGSFLSGVNAAHRKCRPATGLADEVLRESAACPWPQPRARGLAGSGEEQTAPAPGCVPEPGHCFESLKPLRGTEGTESVSSVVVSGFSGSPPLSRSAVLVTPPPCSGCRVANGGAAKG